MEEEPKIHFGLSVTAESEGNGWNFSVASANYGLPEEVIITVVRHWLRRTEKDYFEKKFSVK